MLHHDKIFYHFENLRPKLGKLAVRYGLSLFCEIFDKIILKFKVF